LIALVLRLIPVLVTRSIGIGLDDMFQFDMLSRSITAGNGYRWYVITDLKRLEPYVDFDLSSIDYDPERGVPTSFRAPLYPAFLAIIYYFTGEGMGRFLAVRLVQAGIGALLVPLTYFISRRLFPDREPASVIAAWVVACYPMLIIYPIALATENIFFPLLLTSFLFLQKTADDPSLKNAIFSSLFLALTMLTRSVILPFAGLTVLWIWFILKQKRFSILMALIMLVLIAPWVIRNSLLHQRITGIETSLGYNLYVGYHPESDGSFTFGPSLDLVAILDDAERDRLGIQKALEFIRAQPDRFWTLARNRLGFFLGSEKRGLIYFYSNNFLGYIPKGLLLTIAGILLLPFCIASTSAMLGMALTRPRSGIILTYLLLVTYSLPHVFILSEGRFHLALIPFLSMFAALAWTGGWRAFAARWSESFTGKIAVSIAVLVIVLLIQNWALELFRDADKIATLLGPKGNHAHFPY